MRINYVYDLFAKKFVDTSNISLKNNFDTRSNTREIQKALSSYLYLVGTL